MNTVAKVIATLLIVAIAVVGGSLVFIFNQGFFSHYGISSDNAHEMFPDSDTMIKIMNHTVNGSKVYVDVKNIGTSNVTLDDAEITGRPIYLGNDFGFSSHVTDPRLPVTLDVNQTKTIGFDVTGYGSFVVTILTTNNTFTSAPVYVQEYEGMHGSYSSDIGRWKCIELHDAEAKYLCEINKKLDMLLENDTKDYSFNEMKELWKDEK